MMTVGDEFKRKCEEMVRTYFTELLQHVPGKTKENHRNFNKDNLLPS
jgi:hypothetical protein